jgi:hypothetical protein
MKGELFKGNVESDEEFYIKSGLKGRSYHEEIIERIGKRTKEKRALSSLGREGRHLKRISR